MSTTMRIAMLAVIAAVLSPMAAAGQGVPGISSNVCLAGKTKCVNKKTAGLLACRTKCQQNPANCGSTQTSCETKVRGKFDGVDAATSCFGQLEARQNAAAPQTVCTTTGDSGDVETAVDSVVAQLVDTLEGNPPPSCGNGVVDGAESCDGADLGSATCLDFGYGSGTLGCTVGCGYDLSGCVAYPPSGSCGNGAVEAPESCDGANLGGASCVTLGYAGGTLGCNAFCGYDVSGCACAAATYPATGQTTCWDSAGNAIPCAGTGQDGDVLAGAPLAFADNGDGTISDLNTGLMWEKLSDDGSIHDQDNQYTWNNAFAVHVATLNGGAFAGHTDWRLPNRRELESLYDFAHFNPAVSPAFNTGCTPGCTVTACSCTPALLYWSSTSYAGASFGHDHAWFVSFAQVYEATESKSNTYWARAVRGGS